MGDDERTRWNQRYADGHGSAEAARFLTDRAHLLPSVGTALDVAGGAGRHALWLAERGLTVTLVDVADVAVERVRAAAAARDLPIDARRIDLSPATVPAGPFDVVLVHRYLDRNVWATLPDRLAPGGLLLISQPTVRNLERSARPPRPWLLDEGEAARFADEVVARDPAVTVVEVSEGWTDDDQHEAGIVLRRASPVQATLHR